MSKVVLFLRGEGIVGEKERNEEFRKAVREFLSYIIEGKITFNEYCVNTEAAYERVFTDNSDCKMVFTTQYDTDAQYQAWSRGKIVFEWKCFTNKKMTPIYVEKNVDNGVTSYSITYF